MPLAGPRRRSPAAPPRHRSPASKAARPRPANTAAYPGTPLPGTVLIGALTTPSLNGIQYNPAVPGTVKPTAATELGGGIAFLSGQHLKTALSQADVPQRPPMPSSQRTVMYGSAGCGLAAGTRHHHPDRAVVQQPDPHGTAGPSLSQRARGTTVTHQANRRPPAGPGKLRQSAPGWTMDAGTQPPRHVSRCRPSTYAPARPAPRHHAGDAARISGLTRLPCDDSHARTGQSVPDALPAPESREAQILGVRRVLSVRGIPGVVTRCCRDARVGGRGCSGCWPASAGSVVSASPGWAGGSRAVTGLLLI